MPPHNLREVIDGCVWLIENTHLRHVPRHPDSAEPTVNRGEKLRNLIRLIPAPDFPTAGQIVGRQGAVQAYTTGRGSVRVRARWNIERLARGQYQVVVSELPPGTSAT